VVTSATHTDHLHRLVARQRPLCVVLFHLGLDDFALTLL
jgi:hypothetical protein